MLPIQQAAQVWRDHRADRPLVSCAVSVTADVFKDRTDVQARAAADAVQRIALFRIGKQAGAVVVEEYDVKLLRSIRFARLRRIDHAYVVFDHSYFGSLEVVRPFLEGQRILSCGRYGGWNYSSMEDALHFGRDAAHRTQALLGGAP